MHNSDLAMAQFGILFVFLMLIVLAIGLAIAIFYILTLRKALLQCSQQNRTTSPDSAWLLLIPLFNLVWTFILYPKISESLEREFRSRGIPVEPQPAKTLGIVLAVLQVCGLVPFINMLTAIPVLIVFVMYWVKIAGYSKQLASAPAVYTQPAFAQPPQSMAATQSFATSQPISAPQAAVQAAFCTGCGQPLKSGERFCTSCGKAIS